MATLQWTQNAVAANPCSPVCVPGQPDCRTALLYDLPVADANLTLRQAAASGDASAVGFLLAKGADVHTRADDPLCSAARNGHVAVAGRLLAYSADANARGGTPLRQAARNGHACMARALLRHGADVHAKGIVVLHADRTGATRLREEQGTAHGSRLVLTTADAALASAVEAGHLAVAEALLQHGADVHAEHDLALRLAARGGHEGLVRLLLTHGADVHADHDYTLRVALDRGHEGVMQALRAHAKGKATRAWKVQRATPASGKCMLRGSSAAKGGGWLLAGPVRRLVKRLAQQLAGGAHRVAAA